jgi:hypothetical protein
MVVPDARPKFEARHREGRFVLGEGLQYLVAT